MRGAKEGSSPAKAGAKATAEVLRKGGGVVAGAELRKGSRLWGRAGPKALAWGAGKEVRQARQGRAKAEECGHIGVAALSWQLEMSFIYDGLISPTSRSVR